MLNRSQTTLEKTKGVKIYVRFGHFIMIKIYTNSNNKHRVSS